MAVMGAAPDLAAANTCTGEPTELPPDGEQTVTPVFTGEQPELPVTVSVKGDLKTAPVESHAWTTTK